jgi:hypothetical protein
MKLSPDGVMERRDSVVIRLGRVGKLSDGFPDGLQLAFQGGIQLKGKRLDLYKKNFAKPSMEALLRGRLITVYLIV